MPTVVRERRLLSENSYMAEAASGAESAVPEAQSRQFPISLQRRSVHSCIKAESI
jgi:hypothetical protein